MYELYAPESYWRLPESEKREICNGMGAKDSLISFFIPNTFYGLDMTECGNIHDYMYHIGKTIEDKRQADRVFLNNMLRVINKESANGFMRFIRSRRAMTYYNAVNELGGPAFWAGKPDPTGIN